MPAFHVEISGRAYEGDYHTAANAVFGAMRFRENELYREFGYADARKFLIAPTQILVCLAAGKSAKKVHRVA